MPVRVEIFTGKRSGLCLAGPCGQRLFCTVVGMRQCVCMARWVGLRKGWWCGLSKLGSRHVPMSLVCQVAVLSCSVQRVWACVCVRSDEHSSFHYKALDYGMRHVLSRVPY